MRLRTGHACRLRVTLAGERMFQNFISRFMVGDARPVNRLGDMNRKIGSGLVQIRG